MIDYKDPKAVRDPAKDKSYIQQYKDANITSELHYDFMNMADYWLSEAERLRAENEKLKTGGVYIALRRAYKNPCSLGYDTPSKEWTELLEAYHLLTGLEG